MQYGFQLFKETRGLLSERDLKIHLVKAGYSFPLFGVCRVVNGYIRGYYWDGEENEADVSAVLRTYIKNGYSYFKYDDDKISDSINRDSNAV